MERDFSESMRSKLIQLIGQVEGEKYSDFTDWIGDRWYDFESWIGTLNIKHYIDNVNSYHKKVIDKNNTSIETINQIFSDVQQVDATYAGKFDAPIDQAVSISEYIHQMTSIISPKNSLLQPEYISSVLNFYLENIENQGISDIVNTLVSNENGQYIVNEEKLKEYLSKPFDELSEEEQQAVLQTVSLLSQLVATYDAYANTPDTEFSNDMLVSIAWMKDSEYDNFAEIAKEYSDIYTDVLNYILKTGKEDDNSFAHELLDNQENGKSALGEEAQQLLIGLFGGMPIAQYLSAYQTKYTTEYFKTASEISSSFSSGSLTDKVNDAMDDYLKSKGKFDKFSDTEYTDKDGNALKDYDDKGRFDRDGVFDVSVNGKFESSLLSGEVDFGNGITMSGDIGKTEIYGELSGGLWAKDEDGNVVFRPGVNAEIGASITAISGKVDAAWESEHVSLGGSIEAAAGRVAGNAKGQMQLFSEDGSIDPSVNVKAEAELIAAEVEAKGSLEVLGVEATGSVGVNFGVGAHAEIGYSDGVFKFDVGASLGLGISFDFEIDVGGAIDSCKSWFTGLFD